MLNLLSNQTPVRPQKNGAANKETNSDEIQSFQVNLQHLYADSQKALIRITMIRIYAKLN